MDSTLALPDDDDNDDDDDKGVTMLVFIVLF